MSGGTTASAGDSGIVRLLRLPERAARRVVRGVRAELNAHRWAGIIAAADLVDDDYVAGQIGRPLTSRAAALRYARRGYRSGFRLNPLFVDVAVGDHLPGLFQVPALVAYLTHDPSGVQVSPLWDAATYLRRHPDRAAEPGAAIGAAWRRRRTESLPFGPDALPAPVDGATLAAETARAARTAASARDADVGGEPTSGGTELLIAIGADERDFDESLGEAAAFAEAGNAVAIAVCGSNPETWAQVVLLARCGPRIRAILRPHASPSQSLEELRSSARASVLVLRGPNTAMSAQDMATLAAHAEADRIVAPLWLDEDGTIAAAGTAREGRILAGHPPEDAAELGRGGGVPVPGLAGVVVAAPHALLPMLPDDPEIAAAISESASTGRREVRVDLVARARSAVGANRSPRPSVSGNELLQRAGWEPGAAGTGSVLRRATRSSVLPDGSRVPALRWAIRTAAPAGPRGEWWGDTHFARGLADALRRLGQEVVIDAYPARHRPTTHLDDVTLALRGPEHLEASGTGTSITWIISHPDEITAEALSGFDLVFAASAPWAREAEAAFGREVRPLLQCTDTTRFRPHDLMRGSEIVFVGTARGIFRPSVVEPIRAGIPVRVYGPDWRGWIPGHSIAGSGIPNAKLPAVYETANVVLNDHWPAMQEHGFIANRLYDVIAAGGRVISDHVEGIAETFGGAVVTYRHVDELITLLRGGLDASFPDDDELRRISAGVRQNHSFDARARTLLDAVLESR